MKQQTQVKKLTLVALTAMMVLTGCNTISGLGQDISAVGNTVSNSASQVKQRMGGHDGYVGHDGYAGHDGYGGYGGHGGY